MENVKIEIDLNDLLDLAQRCGSLDRENNYLFNETRRLKDQIKVLKSMVLEKCFYDSEDTRDVTNFYFKDDFARFTACGITLDEIREFTNGKIQEKEAEKELESEKQDA